MSANLIELLRDASETLHRCAQHDVSDAASMRDEIDIALAQAEAAAPGNPARWYCVNPHGDATLCVDEADATETAAECNEVWEMDPPHRAVQLVELGHARQIEQPATPSVPAVLLAWINEGEKIDYDQHLDQWAVGYEAARAWVKMQLDAAPEVQR